jgi:hypothetical protein
MTSRRTIQSVSGLFAILTCGTVIACSETPSSPTPSVDWVTAPRFAKVPSGPTVTGADPVASKRDTTLDVRVLGSGFSSGSRVDFLLNGATDPKVRTNSTRYISGTELVANITIDATATVDYRDVAVTTAAGKKGIGTEAFVVLDGGVITAPGLTGLSIWDVNSSGVAVGYGTSSTGCGKAGFAWTLNEGSRLLPLPSGYCSANPYRVTEGGIIVGSIKRSTTPFELARWTPDGAGSWTAEVIGTPLPSTSFLTAHGVNDVGSLASSWKNSDGSLDSWYWNRSGGWHKLARPAGSTFCELEAMNESDQMTGYCHTTNGNAIYWAGPDAAAVQLPSPPNGVAGNGYSISQAGTIHGSGTIGGVDHTILWIPNGSGGWSIQDLGVINAADRNEQGAMVTKGNSAATFISSGGVVQNLGVHLIGAALANQSADGKTWIVGYDSGSTPARQQAYWFRR